jgi:hypothetical protein
MVVHICNSSTQEAEARRSVVWGQPGLYSDTLFSKKKNKGGGERGKREGGRAGPKCLNIWQLTRITGVCHLCLALNIRFLSCLQTRNSKREREQVEEIITVCQQGGKSLKTVSKCYKTSKCNCLRTIEKKISLVLIRGNCALIQTQCSNQ